MIILYISHLSTNIAAGLNWSVPASVNAQAKIDEVLWVNMTDKLMPHWTEVKAHHNIKEFGGLLKDLDVLPVPFNHPDVVIFEGFYYMDDVRISKLLRKKNIPYIIVPRSSLTKLALHNHAWFKKWVAHKLFFDSFVNHATAIQYLTIQEADDSSCRFHTPYFIIPNGFNTPKERKETFSREGTKAIFIGRLDMFQKGLDLLLDAVAELKDELISLHFSLDIYGPRRYDYEKIDNIITEKRLSPFVTLHDEVGGDAKKTILLNADFFIMTSRFEGHPMGLIEALAYGLPCMVTPGSNMAEGIREANAGWTCEGNIVNIKHTLREIISKKSEFPSISNNARQLAKQYDWNDLAIRFHKEIKNAIINNQMI